MVLEHKRRFTRLFLVVALSWLCLESAHDVVRSWKPQEVLKKGEQRSIWVRASKLCKVKGAPFSRKLLEIVLNVGNVERNPRPSKQQPKLTQWTSKVARWAFGHTKLTTEDNAFCTLVRRFVRLFVPDLLGGLAALQTYAKVEREVQGTAREFHERLHNVLVSLGVDAAQATHVTPGLKWLIFKGVLNTRVPQNSKTKRTCLQRLKWGRQKHLADFIERFSTAVEATIVQQEETKRLLFGNLLVDVQVALFGLPSTCSLADMINYVR